MTINYQDVIDFKLKSAEYHYMQCYGLTNSPNKFDDVTDKIIAISSEFTAIALVYQSILDILAQQINQNKSLKISEHNVTFNRIYQRRDEPTLTDIKNDLIKLNDEAKYLNDYCNTTKHRNLVDVSKEKFYITPFQKANYFEISSFEKDGIKHPSIVINKVLHDIHKNFSETINNLLIKL